MRLRSTARGATFHDTGDATGAHGPATPGSVDPLVVAAYGLESPYVVATRAIRSSILQAQAGSDGAHDGRGTRACALIGLDCDEALAVMAANLGVVMATLGTPTLILDTNRSHPRVAELFHLSDDGDVQATAVSGVWVKGTGLGHGAAPVERRALVEQVDSLNLSAAQMLAVITLDAGNSAASIAGALAGFDAAVIVARKHVTRRDAARGLIEVLDQHGVPITGTILV